MNMCKRAKDQNSGSKSFGLKPTVFYSQTARNFQRAAKTCKFKNLESRLAIGGVLVKILNSLFKLWPRFRIRRLMRIFHSECSDCRNIGGKDPQKELEVLA